MRTLLRSQLDRLLGFSMFRYGLSAGLATLADVGVFAALIYFVLERERYTVVGLSFDTEDWALIFSYSAGVIVHFIGSKYFVFNEHSERTRVQFLRFLVVAVVVYFLNRLMLDWLLVLFNQWFEAYVSEKMIKVLARAVAIVSVGLASFLTHRFYTFRGAGGAG